MQVNKASASAAASENQSATTSKKAEAPPTGQAGTWTTMPVRDILKSESKNLALKIPFSSDKRQKEEDGLEFFVGSNVVGEKVQMYAEIQTDKELLGTLFRQNDVMVFEPSEFLPGEKVLFSRENFNAILHHAAKELENYKDQVFSDSSSEPNSPRNG